MEPACKITRYECTNSDQMKEVERLAAKAELQIDDFLDIYPWEDGCKGSPPPRHYIATKGGEGDETICGWMTVKEGTMEGQNYFYLKEISVIRKKDPSYRGVGRRLHDTLVKEATENGEVDFIHLEPLNNKVAETYKKWGYKKLEGNPKLFYTIKAPPNEAVRKRLMPPDFGPMMRALKAAEDILKDRNLVFLILVRRVLLTDNLAKPENKDKREDFLKLLDTIEAKNPKDDPNALKDKLTEAVTALTEPAKAGRRKTQRRLRRRARTIRRRKESLG